MGSWQVAGVGVPLDVEFESFKAVNRDSVSSSNEGKKVFLIFFTQFMQKVPKISALNIFYLITGVSLV